MRIKQIEISAFGPFKNLEIIDFTMINKKQLFLISGPTGAGKTTIFDAICFALYGKTSGTQRSDQENLRSHFASEDTDTYVKLIFEVQNQTYEIYRFPKQNRYSSRTKGQIDRGQTIELISHEDNTDIYTKISEANTKIEEILGLTYDQFRQIVMLPQGEFKQLLTAKSDEKTEIFRRLFETGLYDVFSNMLKIKSDEAYKKIANTVIEINTLLKNINIDDDQYKEMLEKEDIDYEEAFEFLKKTINDKDNELYLKLNDITQLKEHIESLNQNIQKIDLNNQHLVTLSERVKSLEILESTHVEINLHRKKVIQYDEASPYNINHQTIKNNNHKLFDNRSRLQALELKLKETKTSFNEIEEKFSQIPKLELSLDNLRTDKTNLLGQVDRFIKYEAVKSDMTQIESEIQVLNSQKHTRLKHISELESKFKILENDIVKFNEKIEKQSDYYIKKQALNDHLLAISEVINHKKTLDDHTLKYNKTNEAYEAFLLEFNQVQQTFFKLRTQYHQSAAARLSKTLKKDEPCPVCGSNEHPKIASQNIDVVSDETYNLADESYNKYVRKELEKRFQVNELFKIKNEFQSKFNETTYKEALIKFKSYTDELALINQAISDIEHLKTTIKEKTSSLNELLEDIKLNQTTLNKNNEIIASKTSTKEEKQLTLESLKNELPNQNLAALNQLLADVALNIVKTSNNISETRTKYHETKLLVQSITNQINSIETNNKLILDEIKNNEKTLNDFLKSANYDLNYFIEIVTSKNISKLRDLVSEYDKSSIKLNQSIADLKKQITFDGIIDLSEKKNQLTAHKENLISLETFYNESNENNKNNKKTLNTVIQKYHSYHSMNKDYILVKRLSDMARGITGNRVSFERYVLSHFFDKILTKANHKLAKMTNQRFQLQRKEEKSKGNQTSGLDISVYDRNTSKTRDVQTLSGGETFKASLSLALGLAEVIKENSGGIELDTMFIDEGFGTLDQESLDQAIEVLMNLNQEGRIVGLISHVGELKNVIESVIEIGVNHTGSYVKVGGI